MEERNMYDGQDEIIISFKKIWDNVVKYWWICLVGLILTVLIVMAMTVRAYTNQKSQLNEVINKEEDVKEEIEKEMEEGEIKYYSASMVYLARKPIDLNALVKDAIEESPYLEDRSDYIELYKEYMNSWLESSNIGLDKTLLYDCLALMNSNTVRNKISDELVKNGFEPFDRAKDTIDMQIQNNARFYTVTMNGKDAERVEFIVKMATEILMEKSHEVLGIEKSVLIDETYSYEYLIKKDGTWVLITPSMDEQKTETLEKEKEAAQEALDELSFGIGNFISMKNILIVFVGIFFGLGIIFIMILLDKKVRTRDELAMFFRYPIIGDINEKIEGDEQYNLLATAIEHRCNKEELKTILITSTSANGESNIADKLTEVSLRNGNKIIKVEIDSNETNIEKKLTEAKKKEGLVLVSASNINSHATALKVAGMVDGVLMTVRANCEDIPDIKKAFENIAIVDGNVLGTMLIDSRKEGFWKRKAKR